MIAASAYAKEKPMSLGATGFEWLGYSPEEKKAFAGLLYIALGTKKGSYDSGDVIKKLDDFYYGAMERAKKDPLNVDEDDYLKVKCVDVIKDPTAGSSN